MGERLCYLWAKNLCIYISYVEVKRLVEKLTIHFYLLKLAAEIYFGCKYRFFGFFGIPFGRADPHVTNWPRVETTAPGYEDTAY